ncbi:hypothetical protein E2542_SST08180 [Spatholobus suberectus]|nr:hypothetical protein E2542_SST08180 [Spatholobus suberectus]
MSPAHVQLRVGPLISIQLNVAMEEAPNYFCFVVETDRISDVKVHTVEIHPGIMKIVVRDGGRVLRSKTMGQGETTVGYGNRIMGLCNKGIKVIVGKVF